IGDASPDRDRVRAWRVAGAGGQRLGWWLYGRACHVLPDPGAIECLSTVDEHPGVPGYAAHCADRAHDGDRLAGKADPDLGIVQAAVVIDEFPAPPESWVGRGAARVEGGGSLDQGGAAVDLPRGRDRRRRRAVAEAAESTPLVLVGPRPGRSGDAPRP